MKRLIALALGLCASAAMGAEYYSFTPAVGVNWVVHVPLIDADLLPVSLASGDTELRCEGGTWTDITEAVEVDSVDGMAAISITPLTCKAGTVRVAGTNHLTYPTQTHFVADPYLVYAGIPSAYDSTPGAGCLNGHTITLATTDQEPLVDSDSDGTWDDTPPDGYFNGLWLSVESGDGAGQGSWISTDFGYDATNKVVCLEPGLPLPLEGSLVPTAAVVEIRKGYTRSPDSTDTLAAATVDEFETQSQADPTGFHVNVLEIAGTAQTANDNGADINEILVDTGTTLQGEVDGIQADTEDIQNRIPAALNNGVMPADVQRTNDIEIIGDGSEGDKFRGNP